MASTNIFKAGLKYIALFALGGAITAGIYYKEINNTNKLNNEIIPRYAKQIAYIQGKGDSGFTSEAFKDDFKEGDFFFEIDQEVYNSYKTTLASVKKSKAKQDVAENAKWEKAEKKREAKEAQAKLEKERKAKEQKAREAKLAKERRRIAREKNPTEEIYRKAKKSYSSSSSKSNLEKRVKFNFHGDLDEKYAIERYTNSTDLSKYELKEIVEVVNCLDEVQDSYPQSGPDIDYKKFLNFNKYFMIINNNGELEIDGDRSKVIKIYDSSKRNFENDQVMEIIVGYDDGNIEYISTQYSTTASNQRVNINGKEVDIDDLGDEIERLIEEYR